MTPTTVNRHAAIVAAVSALVGPAAVLLYENGHLRVFRNYHVGDAWFVAAVAAVGVGVAVVALFRRAKAVAVVSMITNGAVLALYAFIAAFFTLGGSR
jgi:hypothetical protein